LECLNPKQETGQEPIPVKEDIKIKPTTKDPPKRTNINKPTMQKVFDIHPLLSKINTTSEKNDVGLQGRRPSEFSKKKTDKSKSPVIEIEINKNSQLKIDLFDEITRAPRKSTAFELKSPQTNQKTIKKSSSVHMFEPLKKYHPLSTPDSPVGFANGSGTQSPLDGYYSTVIRSPSANWNVSKHSIFSSMEMSRFSLHSADKTSKNSSEVRPLDFGFKVLGKRVRKELYLQENRTTGNKKLLSYYLIVMNALVAFVRQFSCFSYFNVYILIVNFISRSIQALGLNDLDDQEIVELVQEVVSIDFEFLNVPSDLGNLIHFPIRILIFPNCK